MATARAQPTEFAKWPKVAQRLPIPRLPAWSMCFLSEPLVKILDDLPE